MDKIPRILDYPDVYFSWLLTPVFWLLIKTDHFAKPTQYWVTRYLPSFIPIPELVTSENPDHAKVSTPSTDSSYLLPTDHQDFQETKEQGVEILSQQIQVNDNIERASQNSDISKEVVTNAITNDSNVDQTSITEVYPDGLSSS